jgi:hypothetical protein
MTENRWLIDNKQNAIDHVRHALSRPTLRKENPCVARDLRGDDLGQHRVLRTGSEWRGESLNVGRRAGSNIQHEWKRRVINTKFW